MKNDPIESALARLDDIPTHTPTGRTEFAKALNAKSNLVVAKAARLIGAAHWIDLNNELVTAFDRMHAKGASIDKACAAMIAIARTLVQLEFDAPDLYLRGIRHIQMEASYGPPIDTATELRKVSAMGLANSTYPHKLRELLPLLVDKEWQVRAGVICAIAVIGTEAASLLLRYKMLAGDKESEVMAECFNSTLILEGADGIPLVAHFVASDNPEIREAAIFAMGASRRQDAVEWLIAQFAKTADLPGRKRILLSLSTSRSEAAKEFLLHQIRTGSEKTSTYAAEALSIHNRDKQLQTQVDEALLSRHVTSNATTD